MQKQAHTARVIRFYTKEPKVIEENVASLINDDEKLDIHL